MKVENPFGNGKEGCSSSRNESMEVFVNPEDGMNIYQMDWEGRQMIGPGKRNAIRERRRTEYRSSIRRPNRSERV